ncbi:hypothetical protein D9619_011600 [Psilocybe cf. subviscida]|uniref:Wax synthase domain-containing protein n=1 Tax=Psilocybe cf. subviscida TaxID=2480587 RepID=A0A8H5BSW8_9AGAR|nr:hypothetical protein D9619_011600 [Psilocybe cf. subviscida]
MRGKVDLQQGLVPLIWAALVFGRAHAAGKNATFTWAFLLVIAWLCIYFIFFTASNDASGDYTIAQIVSGLFFTASDVIFLRNHQPEVRKIGQTKATSAMSFWERLWWSLSLISSPRNIGWSTQPTSRIRPTPPSVTRVQFITSGLKWMCFYALLFDVTSIICHNFPMYGQGGPSFGDFPWLWRATVWLNIFGVSSMMSMTYTSVSVAAVALGLSRPQAWPPYFGNLKDAYTVRNCWGRVWHQMLRRTVTGHGNALAGILHFPKSTFTTYFKLYAAFLTSGLIHYAGDYILFQTWIGPGRSMPFFLLQAVVITFEDAVVGVAKMAGITKASPLAKLLGFCWVFAWFALSVSYWLGPTFTAGTFNGSTPDVSLVQYLWNGQWKVSKQDFI